MDILTGTPESQGVSSEAVLAFVDALEARDLQIISLVLLRGGQKIAQLCRAPYEQDGLRLLFSLSKSFTGIGMGIAIDQGLLSLDDAVISFFPDKLPEDLSDNLRAMTVRHLLTMSCGNRDDIYPLVYPERDWVRAFLAQHFPCAPGSFYRYNTHASYMLSAIVERVTGGNFYAFVKEHLLGPLDIAESSWEVCRQGVTAGGMGLGLSTESVARFGQMLLGGGVYGGRRIVSQRYVALATSAQIDKGSQEKPSRSEAYSTSTARVAFTATARLGSCAMCRRGTVSSWRSTRRKTRWTPAR